MDIQEILESRIIALRNSLTTTDDSVRQLEILAELHSLDEQLARLD